MPVTYDPESYGRIVSGASNLASSEIERQKNLFNLAKEQTDAARALKYRELTKGLDVNNPNLSPLIKGGFASEALGMTPDIWAARLLQKKIEATNAGVPWNQHQVESTLDNVQHQPGPAVPPGVPMGQEPAQQAQQAPAAAPQPQGPVTPPGVPQQAQMDPVKQYLEFKHNPQYSQYAALDPMFKSQYDTQSSLLHDAAIKRIGEEYQALRATAKTPDQVSNAASQIVAKYSPLAGDPDFKEMITAGKTTNPVFNMPFGGIGATMPPSKVTDDAAARIASGQSTVSEEINKGRFTGSTAMQVHNELLNKVRALKPDFSEAESEGGYKFSANASTKRAVQQLDNAYSTVQRLRDVYSKLDNGQFPTINKAINAGKVQTGDVAAAKAAIDEVLGNDELTQAFARGGTGSDKLRDMSAALANKNMSPQQMAAQFDEILAGVDRSRGAYESQGAGYIKPPKYRTEKQTKVHPQDNEAVQWAKANPNDSRSAKILQLNGVK